NVMDYTAIPRTGKQYVGSDGKVRHYVLEVNNYLCWSYGGASYNGKAWTALTKTYFQHTLDTINKVKPTLHQAFFYEIGRTFYDLKLDDILDWETTAGPAYYGYWTLGFNGAMTVLAPEAMGINMYYAGHDTAWFRAERLK